MCKKFVLKEVGRYTVREPKVAVIGGGGGGGGGGGKNLATPGPQGFWKEEREKSQNLLTNNRNPPKEDF